MAHSYPQESAPNGTFGQTPFKSGI
jgi:hypothetical protein